jgi:hypothetical protein
MDCAVALAAVYDFLGLDVFQLYEYKRKYLKISKYNFISLFRFLAKQRVMWQSE